MHRANFYRDFLVFAVILVATTMTLAGCSTRQENKVINSGSDGITIEYDTRYPTMAGVDADKHCAQFGKLAQRVETTEASDMERVTHPHAAQAVFACVSAR